MTFMGNPCPCGWAFDQISEEKEFCERCGRFRRMRANGLLVSTKPTQTVDKLRNIAAREEYDKKGLKLDPRTRLRDILNDRRGAIAAKKAKLRAREDENSNG